MCGLTDEAREAERQTLIIALDFPVSIRSVPGHEQGADGVMQTDLDAPGDNVRVVEARFAIDPRHALYTDASSVANKTRMGDTKDERGLSALYCRSPPPPPPPPPPARLLPWAWVIDVCMYMVYGCRACSATLLKEGALRRRLPLPSPFWHELADMWVCHDDYKHRSKVANMTPAGIS